MCSMISPINELKFNLPGLQKYACLFTMSKLTKDGGNYKNIGMKDSQDYRQVNFNVYLAVNFYF
jgi:hypothetical protein